MCAVGTTTFSGFRVVTSPASVYIRIVSDSRQSCPGSVKLWDGFGALQTPNSAVCGSELFAVEVGVKMRGTFILSWLCLETAIFYI